VIAAVSPDQRIEAGDRLVFVGVVESIVDLRKIRGLKSATDQVMKLDAPRPARRLVEAVVSNSCPLIGRSIRDGKFRSRYNAVVLAVARHGERLKQRIGDIVLRNGDTLLLEAPESFVEQHRHSRDFYLVSAVEGSRPVRHERAWAAMAIVGLMVGIATIQPLGFGMLHAAVLAAGLMLALRCCTGSQARRSVDWQVLVVIAASLALGTALEVTGAASVLASWMIGMAAGNPWVTLAMVYLVTMLLTEMITNNAAAVLVFSIAEAAATKLGADFRPFAFAIMMAASASFSTPIGYQTNLMVMSPGGYRFADYFKVGIPLNLLMMATAVLLIPLIWPLQ
jgi:di/tricarboxylate transporter